MTSEQRQSSPPVGADLSRPPSFSSRPPKQWAFRIATLGIVIVLLSGCMALLWQMQQGSFASHALPAMPDDVSVVGPPSLSAATVNAIFSQVGSPMAGTGATVETLSREYNIDDAFALGVWWTETNDGMAGVGSADRNPGSVRGSPGYPSAWDGYTIYPSYSAAIADWFNILNGRYIRSGLTTVFSIARPYVGTSSYPSWAGKVIALIYRYRGIAPPPPPVTSTPAPKPRPTIAPVPTLSPAMVVQKHRLATLLPREADYAYVRARQGLDTETVRSTPAQIALPVAPAAPVHAPALPASLLYLIMGLGLLAALLLALYARTIGRSVPARAGATTEGLKISPQQVAIFSPLEPQPIPVLAATATPVLSAAGNRSPYPAIPVADLVPLIDFNTPVGNATNALSPVRSATFIPPLRNTDAINRSLPDSVSATAYGKQFSPQQPRPPYLPSRPRQTSALLHHSLFLPSHAEQRVPVAAGSVPERPPGLLTRYKSDL